LDNNKIVAIKKTSSIFLAVLMFTGTITAMSYPSSSFMMGAEETQAQPYYSDAIKNRYNSYEPTSEYPPKYTDRNSYYNNYESTTSEDYGMENNYRNSYGKNNDNYDMPSKLPSSYKPNSYKPAEYPSSYAKENYKSQKDSSKKSFNLNKINCFNTNININGNNAGNVSIGNKGQVPTAEEGYLGAYSSDGSGYGNERYYGDEQNNKKDKGFDCIINNNNNNTNINRGGGNQTIPPEPEPTTENNVYVVWDDDTPGNSEIFFAVSNDNGQTFSTPINLSNNAGRSFEPQISSEGNNVYVVWDDDTPGNFDIFFAVSNDNGQTFSTPINLSNNAGVSFPPQISSEGNNVYVVWEDTTPGNGEILFAVSNDNGQTFSTPINLSNNAGISFEPQISSEVNNVYVVWEDTTPGNFDIFFAVSNDNGQTFSTPINLSNNAGVSDNQQISSEGNNVYVVWDDGPLGGNGEILFTVSNDNGQTFSTPINLSNNAGDSLDPQISSEVNNVYVVWDDDTPGNSEIFFAVSNDNGQIFSMPENISNNGENSSTPQISSEGNNVNVVWEDFILGNANSDIFFAVSNDNGQIFSTPENIIDNAGDSDSPQISTEENNAYIIWRNDALNSFDIFFAVSNDNGQTFSTPENISNNTGSSENPQISSSIS
jgi:hypothetical protein